MKVSQKQDGIYDERFTHPKEAGENLQLGLFSPLFTFDFRLLNCLKSS